MKLHTIVLVATALVGSTALGSDPDRAAVTVEVVEGVPNSRKWSELSTGRTTDTFAVPAFALSEVPRKYAQGGGEASDGQIVSRSSPFLVRLRADVAFRGGTYSFLLRSFGGARLVVDGETVLSTRFKARNADGHEEVPPQATKLFPQMRLARTGHAEAVTDFELAAGSHEVLLEAVVGGKGLRPEIGELGVAFAAREPDGSVRVYHLLQPRTIAAEATDASDPFGAPLTDDGWREYAFAHRERVLALNRKRRRDASRSSDAYWRQRHAEAAFVAVRMPVRREASIDTFIEERLREAGAEPRTVVSDHTFLRRVSLDTRGVVPTPAEIEWFFAEPEESRRAAWIDRMLEDPGWADHWVAYWQDVLAENPGILKPKLNNTGPFRWWIHESFLDAKPIDRFVTELVHMKGSKYEGGAAGFELATENDVPMAAKAHILGTAFLGIDMKCARCHDAPYHPYGQRDLFSIAAMLEGKPIKVPLTSSVPRTKEEIDDLIVEVTLAPGTSVEPAWPFEEIAPEYAGGETSTNLASSRDQLAARITSPRNRRFARVVVNRLWKRYLGYALVEPVSDWDGAKASHPELLDFLERELLLGGYDLKHVARLILSSRAYQRECDGDATKVPEPEKRLFRGPARRRLSAEQLVDSLFRVAGKALGSEPLCLDVDGRRPITTFLNLGVPRRAWEFTSLSNERDRPSLAMPVAQSVIDVLRTFGWRETRQDPITVRDEEPTVLQPLVVANGVVGNRATTLSDDHALTQVAIDARDARALVRSVYLRVLSRLPTPPEEALFSDLLREGFDERVVDSSVVDSGEKEASDQRAVSWSNHLSAEANRLKIELERRVRAGDRPTSRLRPEWRERLEDVVWTLVNSSEFLFVP